MNIKKQFRLNSREIQYIVKTKNKFFLRWKVLNMNFIDQYPDKNFNKFWIGVSSKFHKKAVYRNQVRRSFFDLIYKKDLVNKKIDWKYKKIYVSLKKDVDWNAKDEMFLKKVREDLEKDLNKLFNFVYKKNEFHNKFC